MTASAGLTATVPTDVAADLLGVHPLTVSRWTRLGHITAAVPAAGSQPARYEVAELRRWVRECTDRHGPECPIRHDPFSGHRLSCDCVGCNCGDAHEPGGPVGACRRCHRPLIVDGRVVR